MISDMCLGLRSTTFYYLVRLFLCFLSSPQKRVSGYSLWKYMAENQMNLAHFGACWSLFWQPGSDYRVIQLMILCWWGALPPLIIRTNDDLHAWKVVLTICLENPACRDALGCLNLPLERDCTCGVKSGARLSANWQFNGQWLKSSVLEVIGSEGLCTWTNNRLRLKIRRHRLLQRFEASELYEVGIPYSDPKNR